MDEEQTGRADDGLGALAAQDQPVMTDREDRFGTEGEGMSQAEHTEERVDTSGSPGGDPAPSSDPASDGDFPGDGDR